MIIQDPDKKRNLDEMPDVDENGDPIYKIDEVLSDKTEEPSEEGANTSMKSKYLDTPQDLKDETSQD